MVALVISVAVPLAGGAWTLYIFLSKRGWFNTKKPDIVVRDLRALPAFKRGTSPQRSLRSIEFGVEFVVENTGTAKAVNCYGQIIFPKQAIVPLRHSWIFKEPSNTFSIPCGASPRLVEMHFSALTVAYGTENVMFRIRSTNGFVGPLIPVKLSAPLGDFDDGGIVRRELSRDSSPAPSQSSAPPDNRRLPQ
jgi:hypothetical protein